MTKANHKLKQDYEAIIKQKDKKIADLIADDEYNRKYLAQKHLAEMDLIRMELEL